MVLFIIGEDNEKLDKNMSTNKSPSRVREISIALGSVSPLVFVATYIIFIIVFWGFFLLLPRGSFYHSTAQYEREFLNQDASSILGAIKADILSNLQAHYGNLKISKNDWVVDLSELQVSSLNVSEFPDDISFQVFVPLWYVPPDKQYIQSFLRSTIRLDLKEETFIADRAYYFPPLEGASIINIEGVQEQPRVSILFPSRMPIISVPNVSLPLPLRKQMLEFGEAYRGFPTNVSGNEIRMLYLSVGIATSTALGDITPITTKARILVLTEGIISILLIGLFLNSLASVIIYRRITRDESQVEDDQEFLKSLLLKPFKSKVIGSTKK